MAKCDYFCCDKCDQKIIYDWGGDRQDELAWRFGMDEGDGWKITLVCHECSSDGHIHIIPPNKQEKQ
jgi:hypothetical protein